MTEAELETKKRLNLIDNFIQDIKNKSMGIILVGSLAYAPNIGVRKDSDIDLIVVYKDIKECAKDYFNEYNYLRQESYDGYLVKRHENLGHLPELKSKNENDLNISIHNINFSALQKISYGAFETLAYYRQSQKSTMYYSKDFDGNTHPFKPDCLSVNGQIGERRIDHVAFQSDKGDYVIGNDIDKLLSGAKILYDPTKEIKKTLDCTWISVAKRLIEHRKKYNQKIDINCEDLGPFLFRYNRFSEQTKKEIKEMTKKSIVLALQDKNFQGENITNKLAALKKKLKESNEL